MEDRKCNIKKPCNIYHDDDKNIHINKYPNINFNFYEYGMNLSFNFEIKSSMKYMLKAMEKRSEEFDKRAGKIDGFDCLLFFKIQYQPMDNLCVGPRAWVSCANVNFQIQGYYQCY